MPVSSAASKAALALPLIRRAVGPTSRAFGLGAREQGRDQRAGGKSAGKRQQRRLAERVGGAVAGLS